MDLTPPRARLIHQPPKVSLDTNAIFGIEADEPYVLQYKLDHGMWQNSDGSIIRSTDGAFAAYDLKPHSGPIRFKASPHLGPAQPTHMKVLEASPTCRWESNPFDNGALTRPPPDSLHVCRPPDEWADRGQAPAASQHHRRGGQHQQH